MDTYIQINYHSKTPKFRQIINSVIDGIETKQLKINDKLPSVNKLLIHFDISRDTVVKAYDHLKKMNIIESVPGKGYYVKDVDYKRKIRVFLLFHKLSRHKKIIYDAFVKQLGEDAAIDFFIYNNNYRLFKDLLNSHIHNNYTHFVIIPHFFEGGEEAFQIVNQIPKNKLLILDKQLKGVTGDYAAVYQDFEKDIYNALQEATPQLEKYKSLKLIFPGETYLPDDIIKGFKTFCSEFAFDYDIVQDISEYPIEKHDAFVVLKDNDLITLIKRIKGENLQLGENVGILSYNETPIKEILLDGISVLSTDFNLLGQTAANLILQGDKTHVANPFQFISRKSL